MYEVSLGLIKPFGGYEHKIEILHMIDKLGLNIPFVKDPYCMTREKAEEHYAIHKGHSFYGGLVEMMTGRSTVLFLVDGENAIGRFRILCGATDPKRAEKDTIRYRFGNKRNLMYNAVHASDSPETAKREIKIHLSPEEIAELPENIKKILDRDDINSYCKAVI
jgi:nucleoside-diphosphate kinase